MISFFATVILEVTHPVLFPVLLSESDEIIQPMYHVPAPNAVVSNVRLESVVDFPAAKNDLEYAPSLTSEAVIVESCEA